MNVDFYNTDGYPLLAETVEVSKITKTMVMWYDYLEFVCDCDIYQISYDIFKDTYSIFKNDVYMSMLSDDLKTLADVKNFIKNSTKLRLRRETRL